MTRLAACLALLLASGAHAAAISRDELKKALDANPDLVLEALKKADKAKFFELVVDAQRDFQMAKQAEEEKREAEELENAFKNPLKPALDSKTRFRGDKNAPITLVEYSDFQCPYCQRGYRTVEQFREKYGKKVRFVFKHLPLTNIHPEAMPSAQWMEAIALQNEEKSWKFHDKLFENQDKLGDAFYRQVAKELGVDVEKAAKDAKSKAVQDRIDADMAEAKKFGFSGTPGFLINGVPLRGAYPLPHFDKIVERLGV
jgi:protein-disulfide isomerase